MPQIIVAVDRGAAFGDGTVTFRETVNVADFESQHFATQLVERLGWAVEDADQAEQAPPAAEGRAQAPAPQYTPNQSRARRMSQEPPPQRDERVAAQSNERVTVQSPG
jgi:hypothetical protein